MSDHLGNSHKICRLGTRNYSEWAVRTRALLVRKDLWSVVDPNGKKKEAEGKESGKETEGKKGGTSDTGASAVSVVDDATARKMAVAHAIMVDLMETSQLAITRIEDPRVIWTKLRARHRARGLATEMSLKRKFLTSLKDPELPMQEWISYIMGLHWELEELGITLGEKDVILALTTGLGSEYETLVISLDSTPSDQLTVDFVIERLLNEEARRGHMAATFGESAQTETALAVQDRTCWICGKTGHRKANCPKKKPESDQEPEPEPKFKSAYAVCADLSDSDFES